MLPQIVNTGSRRLALTSVTLNTTAHQVSSFTPVITSVHISALVSRVTGFHLSGEWMWIDNSVVDYTNWNSEEHTATCVEIVSDSGKWRTNSCNKYKSYICKTPKGRPSLISCDIFFL